MINCLNYMTLEKEGENQGVCSTATDKIIEHRTVTNLAYRYISKKVKLRTTCIKLIFTLKSMYIYKIIYKYPSKQHFYQEKT